MTGGKENRAGDTSGIDDDLKRVLGNSQKQLRKKRQQGRHINSKSFSENASKQAKKKEELCRGSGSYKK